MSDIKIYTNKVCPFAHRGTWAAKEKGLSPEFVIIPLGPDKPAWYADINPRATVPCLVHGSNTILESLFVAEYLEDAFAGQGTSLLPKDALSRAKIRLAIDLFGSSVIGALYKLLRNQEREKDDEIKKEITTKVKELLDFKFAPYKGPFFLGEEFSLADIAIVPFLFRFAFTLKHYRDFDIYDIDPRIKTWVDAAKSRPAFIETAADPQVYIDGYKGYAHPAK